MTQFLNPYGGRVMSYALGSDVDQDYGIEVDADMGMTADEKARQDLVDAVLVRDMYLGRTSALADVRFTANRMVTTGADTGMWEVTGSAEATTSGGLIGKVAALEAQVAQLTVQLGAVLGQHGTDAVNQAGLAAAQAAIAQVQQELAGIAKAAAGTP